MERMQSVLVTGGTGFIGHALVRWLSDRGTAVHALVRKASPRKNRLAGLPGVQVVESSTFRATELTALLEQTRVDTLFHLASQGVQPGDRDPEALVKGNVTVLCSVLAAAAKAGAGRVIYTGSCSEYGPAEHGLRIPESHPVRPISLYGGAKAAAGLYGLTMGRHLGLEFVTLRLFGAYGPGEAPQRLIPYLIHKLRQNQSVDLTPGEQVRDLMYIDDVVAALEAAARVPLEGGEGLFNICTGRGTRILEVARAVAQAMGKPQSLLHLGARPYRPDETMWIVGDNTRFCAATQWQPRIGLDEGIRKMVAAARNPA